MRLSDYGIDHKTLYHRKSPLTPAEQRFLGILWVDHVGRERAISADRLAYRYAGPRPIGLKEGRREVRYMQNHLLLDHNVPVLSAAGKGGGYWIAEGKAEADEFYATFRKRGLTGLVKASRGKKSAMVDMVTQLSFDWASLLAQAGVSPDGKEEDAPVEVVDAFLQRMTEHPERFAGGLRKLGEKFGSVLVPKPRYDAIVGELHRQAERLNDLARGLEA